MAKIENNKKGEENNENTIILLFLQCEGKKMKERTERKNEKVTLCPLKLYHEASYS